MLDLARKAQMEKERGPRMAGMSLRLGMEGCNAGWDGLQMGFAGVSWDRTE